LVNRQRIPKREKRQCEASDSTSVMNGCTKFGYVAKVHVPEKQTLSVKQVVSLYDKLSVFGSNGKFRRVREIVM
jgi:hypothetical protein